MVPTKNYLTKQNLIHFNKDNPDEFTSFVSFRLSNKKSYCNSKYVNKDNDDNTVRDI